ncbi:MAG: PAAR domain-containing protein [Microscillaceae bacterium]|nr:PAAR domain-containing protein [Microscillaceae bacterium]
MPSAARLTDFHNCPMIEALNPHVGGPIVSPGVSTVNIGGLPAATVGDMCTCFGSPDFIAKGSSTVFIGGKAAARMGDTTAHGGIIAAGAPTVNIGG